MKILIVDDEIITRKGLINHVHWEDLHITEIKDASDGKEALEIAKTFEPDIILSDIRMPNMDGVTFCRNINKILPHSRIIFLSGYSDKEYLKAAIELGVVSYVEKPVNIAEIEQSVLKATEEIKQYHKVRKANKAYRIFEENTDMIKQKFMNDLIKGHKADSTILSSLIEMGLNINANDAFRIMILKTPKKMDENETDLGVKQKLIYNKVAQWPVSSQILYSIKDEEHILFLFWSNDPYAVSDRGATMNVFCDLLRNELMRDKEKIFCAFGNVVHGMNSIKISYQNAVVELRTLFLKGYNNIVFYAKEVEKEISFGENPEEQFREYLFYQKKDEAVQLVCSLCDQAKKNKNTSISYLKNLFFNIIRDILQAREKWTALDTMGDAKEKDYVWELILFFETVDQIKEYILLKIEELFEIATIFTSNNKTVCEVIKIINSEYQDENLSVIGIAEKVYVTPTYLSTLFKKNMCTTIGEYITLVRIEQSKALLKQKKIKLYEVAKLVGYNDENYFSKAFKKRERMTPSEYRGKYLA